MILPIINEEKMDNIFIYSDDAYARNAIVSLVSGIGLKEPQNEKMAIFTFENNFITEACLLELVECQARRILVLARPSVLNFLSSVMSEKNIVFERYDSALSQVKTVLTSFIECKKEKLRNTRLAKNEIIKLSMNERQITGLYTQGLSLNYIASLMNKSIKTISAHRRSAMKKLGVASNIELIQNGHLMKLLEQRVETQLT